MTISVVVPAYNEEKYIGNCLTHLLNQSRKPDEIIVVDNNSTDKTAEIVKTFPVTMITETKQGMIQARNAGFNFAKTEIIARCDSDCTPPRTWIQDIEKRFMTNTIDGLSGPIIFYDMSPKTPFFANLFADWVKKKQGFDPMFGPNMALTKKVWEKIKNTVCMNDADVHEDLDLTYHIHAAGGNILYDKKLVSYSSARRIKGNMLSFFVEYPVRLQKTLNKHKLPL